MLKVCNSDYQNSNDLNEASKEIIYEWKSNKLYEGIIDHGENIRKLRHFWNPEILEYYNKLDGKDTEIYFYTQVIFLVELNMRT
jgi:hypothetical protein